MRVCTFQHKQSLAVKTGHYVQHTPHLTIIHIHRYGMCINTNQPINEQYQLSMRLSCNNGVSALKQYVQY